MSRVSDRFWSKVDKSGDCWLWTAYRLPSGYGQFKLNGRMVYAHRWAYEQAHGAVPPGMEIDHVCHVRSCVNPAHLRAVTHKQNSENRAGAQANSRSGVRGVSWNRQYGMWQATVKHRGTAINVGRFSTVEDAEAAVVARRSELFTHNTLDRKRCARGLPE